MVDADGFRPNVCMVVANDASQVLFARRVGGSDAWQFPQGGIHAGETPEAALYRELEEETGLQQDCVQVLAQTRDWLRYELPRRLRRQQSDQEFVGQKQKWFLLRMLAADDQVRLDRHQPPEFDYWRWVSYWYPLHKVISFKREVYRQALTQLAPFLHIGGAPPAAAN